MILDSILPFGVDALAVPTSDTHGILAASHNPASKCNTSQQTKQETIMHIAPIQLLALTFEICRKLCDITCASTFSFISWRKQCVYKLLYNKSHIDSSNEPTQHKLHDLCRAVYIAKVINFISTLRYD